MAEILGLGVTHWPTLCLPNEGLTSVFKRTLTAPNVEARYKDPANWPAELIAASATMTACRRQMLRRAVWQRLPGDPQDLTISAPISSWWGDDQYENFQEDIVLAFCLFGYDPDVEIAATNGDGGNGGKSNC
jgi:hypothetical protein